MNCQTSRLEGILRDRISKFSYKEMVAERPSGMTIFQEWLRFHNIKEEKEDKELHISVKHPAAWTKNRAFAEKPDMLLIPVELALKIETLGYIP